jgi:arylsulfatase
MKRENQISRRDFVKMMGAASISLLTGSHQLASRLSVAPQANPNKPNILVLVFDTLSARHMSLHGYPRNTTPNMERFADRAYVYHNHYASGNFTSPGTASILTGAYPWQHRAINLNGIVTREYQQQNIFSLIDSDYHTATYTHNPLAAIFLNQFIGDIDHYHPMSELSLAGEVYADRVASNQFPSAFWSETMLRGTDHFLPGSLLLSTIENGMRNLQVEGIEARLASKFPNGIPYNFKGMHLLLEDAMDWINEQVKTYPQPYLAYYHLWPPHDPYLPSADYIDIFNDGRHWPEKPALAFSLGEPGSKLSRSRQQYDEYLAYVDYEFGRLVDMLDKDGNLNNTIVIVTSDHGELFERGLMGHLNSTLYQDLLMVPLMISIPGQEERSDIYEPTSCIDLLPTILNLSQSEIPAFLQGDILPGLNPGATQEERSVYAMEAKLSSKQDPTRICTLAMIKRRYKLIKYLGYEKDLDDELYDLTNDPEEMENLAIVKKRLVKEMSADLSMMLDQEL